MIIYKTTNLLNSKIYIGQSIYEDESYLGSGSIITFAIKKYGAINFKKEILERCSPELLDERERYWIEFYNSTNKDIGYNILSGGQSRIGTSLPKNTKEKISETLKQYHVDNPTSGKDNLKSRRSYIGENNPNYQNGEKVKGDKNGRYGGKGTTNETREKIRLSKLGKTSSDKTKAKHSLQKSGEKNPMFGKSAFSTWVDKYGIDEANRRKEIQISKIKESILRNKLNKMND
jgi:group I intron endonuclease